MTDSTDVVFTFSIEMFDDAVNREFCRPPDQMLLALARDSHHQSLSERFADTPPAPESPTPVEAMAYRLQTPEGKRLYALRKHVPEPVFGIIKSVLGFRQFLLRTRQRQWRVDTRNNGMERGGCLP